ncbi:eCIS core domain-containing protein [Leptolyngbya sp. GGD]|uniref:eCIS core domain-containing protein n=1 Tax=Leptolyngbya sp. GGD TaxID=2997907 RepID=UPI00227C9856|nr:DUF4157 domain-containing protein [Leptolyngbya sp. GGD]MCY6490791.1 DUF4157 domain-containing protein [Leptolyngbya sp. GGD]
MEKQSARHLGKSAHQVNSRLQPRAFAPQSTSVSQPAPNLRSHSLASLSIQPKLTIGEPDDKYEQEADRIATQVVDQINTPVVQSQLPVQRREEEEELQAKLEIAAIQRQEEEELQTSRETGEPQEASAALASAIDSARDRGQSLDAGLQRSMGQAMGADFSRVRIHADARADQMNRSIQAKAFTTGQDVFFRQGMYEPGTRSGQELIAHELTHVVQQNSGTRSNIQTFREKNSSDQANQAFDPPIKQMSLENIENVIIRIEHDEIEIDDEEIDAFLERLDELEATYLVESMAEVLPNLKWGQSTMTGLPSTKKNAEQYDASMEEALKKSGKSKDMAVARVEKSSTPLARWLYADGPEPSVVNCWESVLLAAFRIGMIDKKYIKSALVHKGGRPRYVDVMMKNKTKAVTRPANKQPRELYAVLDAIPAGMVVAFGEVPGHVALSTGKRVPIQNEAVRTEIGAAEGNEILELDGGAAGLGTVEEAMARNRSEYSAVVTWGALPRNLS